MTMECNGGGRVTYCTRVEDDEMVLNGRGSVSVEPFSCLPCGTDWEHSTRRLMDQAVSPHLLLAFPCAASGSTSGQGLVRGCGSWRLALVYEYGTRTWPKIGNKHSPKTHLRQACGRGKGDSYSFEPCPGKVFNAFVIPGFVNNPLDFLLHSFTVSLSFLPRNYTTPSQSPAGLIYFLPSS